MTRSSPARRSPLLSSPEPGLVSDFLYDDRNNELSHLDALEAARIEHERVRQTALRVYELHELQLAHRRILEDKRKEEQKHEAEKKIAAEQKLLQELQAKKIAKPPPEPKPEPPLPRASPTITKTAQPAATISATPKASNKIEPSTTPSAENKIPAPAVVPQTNGTSQAKPAAANPFATTATQGQGSAQASPFSKVNGSTASTPMAPQGTTPTRIQPTTVQPPIAPSIDRYTQIHQELKRLRKELQAQSKVAGSPLKGKMGAFRREIRVSIGQLTGGKGANAQPINKISATLKEALEGRVPSPPIDVSLFTVDKRNPVEGASNNDATLPSLFIYLMNICAKGIINQFINECSANRKAADPIGVFTAHIFSHKDFEWRGQSLIDILMAKFRIVCPVLFGFRGNDRTERGRTALGWKKEGPAWVTEQSHNDRMAGLGAGYASLSLRDFSKTTKTNPYPPTNYWKALAGIVNSPPNEISNTQYIVLRSMIEGHEQRFLNFYGNAALAALRLALVEFPNKAPPTASAAGSLRALADVLRTEGGLVLA